MGKSPNSNNFSINTSLNVRSPSSNQISSSEEANLMYGYALSQKIQDLLPRIEEDTFSGYYSNDSMISDNNKDGVIIIDETDCDEDEYLKKNSLSPGEVAIKQNIYSIGMNLQIMQKMGESSS